MFATPLSPGSYAEATRLVGRMAGTTLAQESCVRIAQVLWLCALRTFSCSTKLCDHAAARFHRTRYVQIIHGRRCPHTGPDAKQTKRLLVGLSDNEDVAATDPLHSRWYERSGSQTTKLAIATDGVTLIHVSHSLCSTSAKHPVGQLQACHSCCMPLARILSNTCQCTCYTSTNMLELLNSTRQDLPKNKLPWLK